MKLSVIVPCFNHGQYIQDAIDSVLLFRNDEIEIIIVDDGSTDEFTIKKMNYLEKEGFKVITHINSGLGFTRNAGIRAASGKYILPLDADNKITPEYIRKSIALLDDDTCDIVYGNPIFFGDDIENRRFEVMDFNGIDLLFGNYIDACAVFKKQMWIDLNGYDEKMPFNGNEDWEFWIHAFLKGYRFLHVNEQLYHYRILANSMLANTHAIDKENLNYNYIVEKHGVEMFKLLGNTYFYSKMYQRDLQKPMRSSLKYFVMSIKNLLKKAK